MVTVDSFFEYYFMKVEDIMTKEVINIKQDTKILDIAGILDMYNITGVPVVSDENCVIGIVTEADFLTPEKNIHIPSYLEFLTSLSFYRLDEKDIDNERGNILSITAKDIMTRNVITITPDESIQALARVFNEKRINPVPVVDKYSGKLVGIVSRRDIINTFVKNSLITQ